MSDDWDTDTSEVTAPVAPEDNWRLSREQLQLFVEHHISIPPKMHEVVRLLEALETQRAIDWTSLK